MPALDKLSDERRDAALELLRLMRDAPQARWHLSSDPKSMAANDLYRAGFVTITREDSRGVCRDQKTVVVARLAPGVAEW